jgi:CII-binding regulator of phage lambda lysogenization HflD
VQLQESTDSKNKSDTLSKELQTKLDKATSENITLKQSKAELDKQIEGLKNEIKNLNNNSSQKSSELQGTLDKQQSSIATFEKNIQEMKTTITEKDKQIQLSQKQLEEFKVQTESTLKAKVQEFENQTQNSNKDFETKMNNLRTELKTKMNESLAKKQKEFDDQLQGLQNKMKSKLDLKKKELEDLSIKLSQLEQKHHEAEVNMKDAQEKIQSLASDPESRTSESEKLTEKLAEVQVIANEVETMKENFDIATKELTQFKKKFDEMEKDYKESEEIRRKLHNKIEDAKGKIRVYARCRPLSKSETANNNQRAVALLDNETMRIIPKKRDFVFSRVFGEDSTQEEVFKETSDLIQSSLDGFNVCIFAYGQTGSGKTFTIAGADTPELEGLVPRSMKHLFHLFKKNQKMFKYEVECYMLELYLDELYDLFNKGPKQDLKIKKDSNGNVVVLGTQKRKAESYSELYQIYNDGGANRHTRQTKMNEASSRSHLVFSILITGTNLQTGEKSMGKLTLVDLAGSESRKKTQTDDMGNKEALSINGSLLCLGEVIAALSEKKKYVPYRNSPLTMLLSDSLGGVAKTLMFVCVSPADYNVEETITSLTYATRVKTITNNLKAQVDSVEVQKLKRQIDKLKTALTSGGSALEIIDDTQDIADESADNAETIPAADTTDQQIPDEDSSPLPDQKKDDKKKTRKASTTNPNRRR